MSLNLRRKAAMSQRATVAYGRNVPSGKPEETPELASHRMSP